MIRVVQIISSSSVYNDNLQRELMGCEKFSSRYRNACLNMDEISAEFASKRGYNDYPHFKILSGIIFRLRLNSYLRKKYSGLKGSICNIQYVDWFYILLLPFLKKTFSWIIVCFWGSDLLRVGKLKLCLLKRFLRRVNIIALLTDEMAGVFRDRMGLSFDNKIRIVRFGNSYFDLIDRVDKSDIMAFTTKYNIDTDRRVVSIGYNSSESQKHKEVITSIIDSGPSNKEIFIIIPWTYGSGDTSYKKEISGILEGRYDYIFLDSFLSDNEIAFLRIITDVLINVQPTDVMSASMYETLYGGGAVIAGSWLPYDDLYQRGVNIYTVDSVSEVGNKLLEMVQLPQEFDTVKKNHDEIGKLYSWKSNIDGWINLYSEGEHENISYGR